MIFSNKFLVFLSELIVTMTYSVVMFSLIQNKDEAFYVNYVFTLISFILTLWVFLGVFKEKITLHNLFYQFPLFSITLIYGVGQLFLSGVLAYYKIPTQWTLSISTIVLGLYGTSAISAILINRFHSATREIPTEERTFIQDMKLALFDIQQDVSDKKIKAELEKLLDLITYSDPVSLPETEKIETDIMKFISGINPKTLSKQNISRIKDMLERRNHLLKNIK